MQGWLGHQLFGDFDWEYFTQLKLTLSISGFFNQTLSMQGWPGHQLFGDFDWEYFTQLKLTLSNSGFFNQTISKVHNLLCIYAYMDFDASLKDQMDL